jgi:mannitol 2-dehydrogenase
MKAMNSVKLNRTNLSFIKETRPVKGIHSGITVPSYEREQLRPAIVHIGLGHFHRAHQAVYLDELLSRGLASSGLFEMNLVADRIPIGEILPAQDYLYTLITKSAAGERVVRVVGAVTGYLNAGASPKARETGLSRLADEGTKLITLTVTEGGYYFDKATGKPDPGDPAVRHDMENPEDPRTAAAFLAAALARRYKQGGRPLTIMCCDNIPANGKVLKSCVLSFCGELYPGIVSWAEDRVSFPCSMVDRITPGTTAALVKELEEDYGIIDGWPVCGEDFCQWVLEDNFKTEIPDYAAAGVQIVKDVEPYELMKMRLLNGSHSALAYTGYLLGCRTVDEAITHPLIKTFIRDRYMEEVTPTLASVGGIDLVQYKDTLVSRFSNKNIGDTILRLASEGSSKIPIFMLKPLADAVRAGLPRGAIIFALAAWARFLRGTDEQGRAIPLEDSGGWAVSTAAKKAQTDPRGFLITAGLQGLSETGLAETAEQFSAALDQISRRGIKAALGQR